LIQDNFAGRDELYAAAESLDDDARANICRRLAEHLAANAIELQQIVTASGREPAAPLDVTAIANALFELVKEHRGEDAVLGTAARGEKQLKSHCDHAIESATDPETESILRRQREGVEFGEDVLRNIALLPRDLP
jgi:uncharacterized protein (TIGR02284 family)